MSRLITFCGDDAQLERALNALQAAGLADNMRVIGGRNRVGRRGRGRGSLSTEIERLIGGNAEEARFYTEAVAGGASLLVVEGGDDELDRA